MSEPDMPHVRGVALACSPRPGGNTDLLVAEYVRGMTDGGATVEVGYIRDRHIESWRGWQAWTFWGLALVGAVLVLFDWWTHFRKRRAEKRARKKKMTLDL